MNIKFSYLYRDGANYKNFNEVVFANPNNLLIKRIEEVIKMNLIDGQWFVANKWNLPDMHFKEFGWDSEIDHEWHEFDCLEQTLETVSESISIDEFLNKLSG